LFSSEVLLLIGMVLVMFVLIVAAGLALLFMPDTGFDSAGFGGVSTLHSTTTSSTLTSTSIPVYSTTTTTVATTTTVPALLELDVAYSPSPVHRGDFVRLNVTSGGVALGGVSVYLDGKYGGDTLDGVFKTPALGSGLHRILLSKGGYGNVSFNLNVSSVPYTSSREVYRLMSQSERNAFITGGYVSVRYYYTPVCPQCRIVEPKLDELVRQFRDCILYEKVNLLKPEHAARLKGRFGPSVQTPFLEFEGVNGVFTAQGLVHSSVMRNLFERAGGWRCGGD
jgi:thiol-disulfide isomerase/thioredoxin